MEQAHAQVSVAARAGADGVVLTPQGGCSAREVLDVVSTVECYPRHRVGVNLLGVPLERFLFEVPPFGFWCCNAEVSVEEPLLSLKRVYRTATTRRRLAVRGYNPLYFGEVAFKGQVEVPPDQLGAVAYSAALSGVDVVVTSGARTGVPPGVQKVAALREALGDHPLGVASGINLGNVDQYLPYCDVFLVGTGVEAHWGELDPSRIVDLTGAVHGTGSTPGGSGVHSPP